MIYLPFVAIKALIDNFQENCDYNDEMTEKEFDQATKTTKEYIKQILNIGAQK